MANISQVNLPNDNNNPYDIADTTARSGLADKMDKTNPTGSGSFSLNRKANTTIGDKSFAEGKDTTASGYASHAEGQATIATSANSHAEGLHTTANHKSQHVFGEFNVSDDSTAAAKERGKYVEIVGNGNAEDRRSNARTLDWSGNEVLAGSVTANGGFVGDLTGTASSATTVNGHTVNSDVPANAVFTDTQSDWNATTGKAVILNKPTIPTVTDTYSSTGTNATSGKAVAAALSTLDGTVSGTAGAGRTLTAFSQTDGKVSATFGNISITKSQVSDFPTLGTAAAKNFTTSVTSGSADLVTSGAVYTAIDNLPEPMVFKGTLGTGGTITTLPTAAASNEGYTYKVITAGTYASQAAKVGDVFVSAKPEGASAYSWILIPAGDTDSDTWRSIKVNGTQLLGSAISTGAVNFKSGSNVTVTGSGNDITIAATDNNTTYTFANGTNGFTVTPSGGTAQTVTVTPSITNNVTGSGTSGYIAKFNGAHTVTNGPQLGSSTTTYLNNAGSWATPPDTKNTAGSTDTSSKIYLIGATSQAANPQTYSQDTAYVGTDGCLYSGGSKVLTSHQDISGKVNRSGDTMTGALNFANTTANKMGNDAQVGDHNRGGSFGVQGLNGPTTITLLKQGGTWGNTEGGSIQYNATTKSLDFIFT